MTKYNKYLAIMLFFTCFLITAFTIKDIGITWDEPIGYFYGAELVVRWGKDVIKSIKQGNIQEIFSEGFIDKYWGPPTAETQKTIYPNNHPPVSRYIPALSWIFFHSFLSDFLCYRLSSAFLFALLITFLFLILSPYYGKSTALFASCALFFMPRVFGHAHIAASEIPYTTMWFLSAFFFWKAIQKDDIKSKIAFSFIYGLALLTKFPALIIPIPLCIFTLLYKRKQWRIMIKTIAITILISPLAMILLNPTFWHNPIKKIIENHILLGLSHTNIRPIAKYYFGKIYIDKKPWHMPLVLFMTTTPWPILIAFFLGIFTLTKNKWRDELASLFILNIIVLFSILMLPSTNFYDGIRHLLPIYPFVAGIAAIGFKWFADKILVVIKHYYKDSSISFLPQKVYITLFILFLTNPLISVMAIHPYELAYYNELIGGVKGAFKRGMETTYWFDAANERFLTYLNDSIPSHSRIFVYPPNLSHFIYLQKKGYIRKDLTFTDNDFNYLIILFREGTFSPLIWRLYDSCNPIFSITVDTVPLISVYKVGIV